MIVISNKICEKCKKELTKKSAVEKLEKYFLKSVDLEFLKVAEYVVDTRCKKCNHLQKVTITWDEGIK